MTWTDKPAPITKVRMLVYSQIGAGREDLIKTLPNPCVLTSDNQTITFPPNIPVCTVSAPEDLRKALKEISDMKKFDTLVVDSMHGIAQMQDNLTNFFDEIAALDMHVVLMTDAIREQAKNSMYFNPLMPHTRFSYEILTRVHTAMALRIMRKKDGNLVPALQCIPILNEDAQELWAARDMSRKLDFWERADLGAIIQKITCNV